MKIISSFFSTNQNSEKSRSSTMDNSNLLTFIQITATTEKEAKRYQEYGYSLDEAIELYFNNPIPEEIEQPPNTEDDEVVSIESPKNEIDLSLDFENFNKTLKKFSKNSTFPFHWKQTEFRSEKPQYYKREMKAFYSWFLRNNDKILVKTTDNYSIVNSLYEFDLKKKIFSQKESKILETFNLNYETNKLLNIDGEIHLISHMTQNYSSSSFKIEKLIGKIDENVKLKQLGTFSYAFGDEIDQIVSYKKKIFFIFKNFNIYQVKNEIFF